METIRAGTVVLLILLSALSLNGCALGLVGAADEAAEEIAEDERMMEESREKAE